MSESNTTSSSSSSSPVETLTSTLLSTLSQTITATATITSPLALSTPTSTSVPTDPSTPSYPENGDPYLNPDLLCDWTRSAVHCRDADFIKYMLVASSIAHLFVGLYGIWLLAYRNRGFNSKIVSELFTKVGTGVRPKPMDCIIFFTTIACFDKVAANLILVFGALQDSMWLRVAIEQIYWIFVAFAFSSYFVGLLYAMPVTTREGIFAVYQPEVVFGAKPLPPIHVLTPTTVQKNFMLAMGAIYPTIFAAGLGVASGVLHDKGQYNISRVLLLLQYSNWVLILYAMAALFFYYGLKYTFILRANIIIAEAALKAPRAAFGIGNLKSRSPARFLFIQLQITGFGGCAVTVLAGTLCILWVLFKDKILEMPDEILPHVMAVFWTCAIALAFFVVFTLIAAQSIRNRRRGLHEPSTTTATGTLSYSGDGQKSAKLSKSGQQQHQQGQYGSDPETRLTQHSSGELSSLDSEKASLEQQYEDSRYIHPGLHMNDADRDRAAAAASVAAMAALSDRMDQESNTAKQSRDSWRPVSPTSPSRPLTIQINSSLAGANNAHHNNIRESVFGGRTPREDGTPGSPPAHGGGFSLPSFPLVAIRSASRNSVQQHQQHPRPSTSSASHTTSTNSSRLSHGSSQYGTSSSGSHTMGIPLPPTIPNVGPALALQQQTQQQLQQLQHQQQQQQPGYAPRMSTQRTHVKSGTFQSIPEVHSPYLAEDDDRGDLLFNNSSLGHIPMPPSTPPYAPHRTKSTASNSSSARMVQPSPIIVPMPPTVSPGLSLQQVSPHHDASPRPSTSSARSYPYNSRELSIDLPTDMQLQQQHPLHQVAFKGLSPPPRSTPLSPTSPTWGRRIGGAMKPMSPPTSPMTSSYSTSGAATISSSVPASPALQSPMIGGGTRRASNSAAKEKERENLSAPIAMVASRGPGGGYQSQKVEPPTHQPQPQPQSQPQPQPQPQLQSASQSLRQKNPKFHQQQEQKENLEQREDKLEMLQTDEDEDDSRSIDSAGEDAWPLPPTFK